jgi:hypothetical protein
VTLDGVLDWIYSAIANFYTLWLTRAHAKSLPACSIFTTRFLVTASNNGYCSASRLKFSLNDGSHPTASFLHRLPCRTDSAEYESYIRTDGQSASLSWNKAPIWGLRPDFYYCQTLASLLMWGTLSVERTVVKLLLVSPTQPFSCLSPMGLVNIFYCLKFETSLLSPATTGKATVEVFDPTSTLRGKSSLMLWLTVSRPVCLGIKHLSGAYDQIFITVRQLRACWCGAYSLTRGRVCHLQLQLVLASTVDLVAPVVFLITSLHGPSKNHLF